MIITRKAISRRTLLRGLGATIALPLLDAMVPAFTALAKTPAAPVMRFGAVYVPNGVIPSRWFPTAEGADFEFSPSLEPLKAFRDRIIVLSGLDSTPPQPPRSPSAVHGRASTKFLTDVFPDRILHAGPSMDQIAAKVLGATTQLPSLELALESVDSGATCDDGSCIYLGTISWTGPTTPLPMECDPAAAFERLFGADTTNPAEREARRRQTDSILDAILGEIESLRKGVGPADRARLSEYLESIRAVEQRIQKASAQNLELPSVARPSGIPPTFQEHAKLMLDLQTLAYQADVTRVTTFMIGREFSGRTYPEIGVPDAHHPISHHRNELERMEKCAKINQYHVSLFSYFLEKLQSTADGDGSLLEHVTLVYGAGMGEGNTHAQENIPVVLAGGASGQLKGGRHIHYPKGTQLANLHVSLLDKLGAPVDKIGNSDGMLNLD
jgi:Protein of unknown function (DUF1552)